MLEIRDAGTLVVSHVVLGPDPFDPSQTALFVGGTANNDEISIELEESGHSHASQIEVEIESRNFELEQHFTANVSRIVIFAGAGNDKIEISRKVTIPVLVFGGDGNDEIQAGGGSAVLNGGAGNDKLTGGSANDLLFGGAGKDSVFGRDGQDLLIAGTTNFDANLDGIGNNGVKDKIRSHLDNHGFDGLVSCAVAASVQGESAPANGSRRFTGDPRDCTFETGLGHGFIRAREPPWPFPIRRLSH